MHALEWIQTEGKYLRAISTVMLRHKLGRTKDQCTWCGQPRKKGFLRYCSRECKDQTEIRLWRAKWEVEKRDKGICTLCGLDTLALRQRMRNIQDRAKEKMLCHTFSRIRRLFRAYGFGYGNNPFDIDHLIPVCEGGGLCNLDGLRTLCKPCHKKETKALRARLRKK